MSAEESAVEAGERSAASEFIEGARVAFPVIVASSPFGLLFGAIAIDNGLSIFDAVLLSATVYAGASQMVGIELFGQNIAPWLVVFSIFAVNFRHVLYSAAVGRRIASWPVLKQAIALFFLVDPQYAESERRAEQGKPVTFVWYMGMALPIYSFWIAGTVVGAVFGRLITNPHALGLDFLLPIYFLGLVMGFHKRPLWLPLVIVSGIASILAFKFVGSPWHVSLGALAGILLAAIVAPTKPELAADEQTL
jgi:predicted branched-subunit amino acid permease